MPIYPCRQAPFTQELCSHCYYVHEVCVTILSLLPHPSASQTLLPPPPPPFVHYLYSSLCPYAITMSVNSFITISAHLFISCSALRSFGFSKPWPSENLSYDKSERNEVKPSSDFVKNIFARVPVKISSIYSNNDPAVHKALIVLLELFYIFIFTFRHFIRLFWQKT